MADKQISQLVAATTINNDDLFVMQQGGTAKKLSGQKLSDFVYQSAADQIERVDEAVEQAQAAVDNLEEQKNEIAQAIASMAELGTDTTLSTPGMAADAAATGEVKDVALARFEQDEITGVPIATFDDGADNVPIKKLVVNIEPVQSGSGDPSPENVRPITGWTGANVTKTGKNLLPPIETTTSGGLTFTQDGDYIDITGTRTGSAYVYFMRNVILPAGEYTINGVEGSGNTTFRFGVKIGDGSYAYVGAGPRTYTSDGVTPWMVALFVYTSYDHLKVQYWMEAGTVVTGYEPYQSTTYPITFPSEAGTVYGGTLDVTNGVLTVDKAMITLDGSEANRWQDYSTGNGYRYASPDTTVSFQQSGSISNQFVVKTTVSSLCIRAANSYYLWFCQVNELDGVSDLASWLTWLSNNPVQFSYKITPIVYQLTPTEVKTLLGQNNIWADSGNINELIYRKMPIPADELENTLESMIASVEETMEATQNYTAGKLVIAAHKLYHITSNIAAGETIEPETNCYLTTIDVEFSNAIGSLGNVSELIYQVVT